jgi:uncharacterized protein YndB with AHSA1/START domain
MMWTTEYALSTEASPEAVWQLLSDVDGWGSWNHGIETVALDGPLAVGATFRMKPPGEDELISTVVELQPNRLFTDLTRLGDVMVRVVHRLDPLSDGRTSISYRVEVSGALADADAAEIGAAVSADFPDVIAALAAAAVSIATR